MAKAPLRYYRFPELKTRGVPLCRTTLKKLERNGQFPQRVYLTERMVAWPAEEVDSWVRDRRRHRQRPAAPTEPANEGQAR